MCRENYGITDIEKTTNEGVVELDHGDEQMLMSALSFLKDLPFRNIRKPLEKFVATWETPLTRFEVEYYDYDISDKEKFLYKALLEILNNISWSLRDEVNNLKDRLELFMHNSRNQGKTYFYSLYENMHHEVITLYRRG